MFFRMYSSNKQDLHKSSSLFVIFILLSAVSAKKTNADVFGGFSSMGTGSYCTSPSVEQIKSKDFDIY